jgi:peptidoglycan/LPS O-acetylase OafA/YrhL
MSASSSTTYHIAATERYHGLDTLRAIAILLVLMYHYMAFVSGMPTFGWLSTAGWIGVDLFFALSGYLVGNQVIRSINSGHGVNLVGFYGRRILRTWPLFWLILAAYFIFPEQMGGKPPPALWRFLTFTQNFNLQPGTAFSHAWSLCIEEQFYLLLPLVVIITSKMRRPVVTSWIILASLVGAGVAARYFMWLSYGLEADGNTSGYFPNIYYSTLCRFDEFLPGVAVALVRNCHPATWKRIAKYASTLFFAGLVSVSLIIYGAVSHYYVRGTGYPLFMTVFGYSLVSASFSLLVASAL